MKVERQPRLPVETDVIVTFNGEDIELLREQWVILLKALKDGSKDGTIPERLAFMVIDGIVRQIVNA